MFWLWTAVALAAPAEEEGTLSVGASIVGEVIQDSALTLVYGGTSVAGEGSAAVRGPQGLEGTVHLGYRRLGGTMVDSTGTAGSVPTWLWYAPVAATIGGSKYIGTAQVFGGIGPALVIWSEQPDLTASTGSSGGKFGVLAEGGTRIPVPGVRPSLYDPERGIQGVAIEISFGYRYSFRSYSSCQGKSPCGLDFSGLRFGAGAKVSF